MVNLFVYKIFFDNIKKTERVLVKKFLALGVLALLLPACNCKKTETWCSGDTCHTKATKEVDGKVVSQTEKETPNIADTSAGEA